MSLKIISSQELHEKISMPTAIDLMKQAFSLISSNDAIAPARTVLDTQDHSGRALFMPSYSSALGLFGLKMVSLFEGNAKHSLATIQGQMLVMDAIAGTPLALIEAASLTALRTGAASGLATHLLARKDAGILAVFGTGAQAITQIEAILCARKLHEILVFGSTRAKAELFCNQLKKITDIPARPAFAHDLKTADIICTATTSATPLFTIDQIKEGVHINGIGSYRPTMQEIAPAIIHAGVLVVDQRKAALEEAGDIVIPIRNGLFSEAHIHAELGEIINGHKKGRVNDQQITIFKSVGNALQDLVVANFLVKAN